MPQKVGWTKILAAEFADRTHRPIDLTIGLIAAVVVVITAVLAAGLLLNGFLFR